MTNETYMMIDDFIDANTPTIVNRMEEESLILSGAKLSGGKKLRGNLTMLVAEAFSGNTESALDYAAAIEFIHTGSLEHDDVLDGHDERRGKPTHQFMAGIQKAILAGDIMFCAANRIASQKGNAAAVEVANSMQGTLDGVLKEMDVDKIIADAMNGRLEKDLYMDIVDRKTGTLFSCASKFGAMTCATESLNNDVFEKNMGEFGMMLGEAYQIADDIVDIVEMSTGEKEITPLTVMGVIPAILNYEGSLIKRIPLMAIRGKLNMTDFFGLIEGMQIESKMMDDVREKVTKCEIIIDGMFTEDDFETNEYARMLRAFPAYAVSRMLSETDVDGAGDFQ